MKMQLKAVATGLALVTVLTACGSDKKAEGSGTAGDSTEVQQATLAEDVVSAVVDAYLGLKDALVASDDAMAKEKATAIVASLGDGSSEDAKHLMENAQAIVDAADLEAQRTHFEHLSADVYSMVKNAQMAETTLYKQYCPMAFNNKGAFWLSSSEEVRNPYFGDAMLKCGRVEETIN